MGNQRWQWSTAAAIAAAGLVFAAAGCSSTTPSGTAGGPVTLTVWYEGGAGVAETAEKLVPEFEAAHPGVKVKLEKKNFEQLTVQAPLALSGDSPPDIVEMWEVGYAGLGKQVKAQGIVSLDRYVTQYGWDKRFPAGLRSQLSFTQEGKQWGSGSLYSVPIFSGAQGVYYNKEKLSKLGLGVPKTLEEFLAAVEAAKKAGETPIMLGDAKKFPLGHVYEVIQDTVTDKDHMRRWIYGEGRGELDYGIAQNIEAAAILQKLGTGGGLNANHSGTELEDSVNRFGKGEGVFLISGTWFAQKMQDLLGDKVGFFAMPGKGGRQSLTTGATGNLAIAARSKNQDTAAAFLDFLTSDQGAQALAGFGGLPSRAFDAKAPAGSVLADAYAMYASMSGADAINPYIGHSAPGMGDTTNTALQQLAAGQLDPAAFAAKLQAEYKKYWSSQQ